MENNWIKCSDKLPDVNEHGQSEMFLFGVMDDIMPEFQTAYGWYSKTSDGWYAAHSDLPDTKLNATHYIKIELPAPPHP